MHLSTGYRNVSNAVTSDGDGLNSTESLQINAAIFTYRSQEQKLTSLLSGLFKCMDEQQKMG